MRSRLRLSRRWTSPFTTSRRTGVRRAIGLPAYERLEERTLLTPVAGVYDENISNTNTVDSVAPASHFSATQFASDIAAAFRAERRRSDRRICAWHFWEFGLGRGKSLEINAAEGTNWAIGTGFSISGTGSYSSTPDGGNNFTSLEFTSIRAGGHTGTLLDEHVVKFGVTVTSTGSNYGNVMVTGRLASGGTVSASRVIDGGSQFEDTFYGLAAPTGDHFVGFRMQYDGNPAYVPLRFDDIGFITSEAAASAAVAHDFTQSHQRGWRCRRIDRHGDPIWRLLAATGRPPRQ